MYDDATTSAASKQLTLMVVVEVIRNVCLLSVIVLHVVRAQLLKFWSNKVML